MDRTNLAGLVESLEDIPDSSQAQWDAARRLIHRMAPDLADCVLGEAS